MRNEQELINSSIKLAEKWQNRATELVSDFDREFYVKMNKMLEHPKDKALLIELIQLISLKVSSLSHPTHNNFS